MSTIGHVIRAAIMIAVLALSPAQAQNIGVIQSDILVLDTERLFNETQLGRRITEEYQAERDKLIARNREIEAELEAEELALTQLRAEKTPEEFRELADAFDSKVQEIRRESERRVVDLERSREQGRAKFMRMIEPILIEILNDAGSTVLMDKRTMLLSSDVIDITELAIDRVNQAIGTGEGPEEAAPDNGQQDTGDPEQEPKQSE